MITKYDNTYIYHNFLLKIYIFWSLIMFLVYGFVIDSNFAKFVNNQLKLE